MQSAISTCPTSRELIVGSSDTNVNLDADEYTDRPVFITRISQQDTPDWWIIAGENLPAAKVLILGLEGLLCTSKLELELETDRL